MAPATLSEEQAVEVRKWLTTIGSMLQSSAFKDWNTAFLVEHCASFEDADENKLEHTQLHAKYQEEVESKISAAVQGTDVDLEALMTRLPAYMERAKTDEEMMDSAVHETIDTLTSLSDFESFKAAMLVTKREGSGTGLEMKSGNFDSVSADEHEMAHLVAFAQAMDAETEGWTELVKKPWMVMSKRPAPPPSEKTHIIARYVVDFDLGVDDVTRVFADYSVARKAWDETVVASEVVHTFPEPASGGSDIVHRISFKVPYLVRLTGWPDKIVLRCMSMKDQPKVGEWTVVCCAWDEAKNAMDPENTFFQTALGIVRPSADDPARSRYTGLEKMGMAKVPNWLMSWMAGAFAPKLMMGYVDKYKRNVLGKKP